MPLYEFEEGTSRKFYRIDLDGRRVLLHWGRIGYEGEHQILSFETDALAKAEYDRQCEKRTSQRGYRVVFDEGVPHDPEKVSRDRLVKAAPLTANPRFLFGHAAKKKFAWVEARGSELVSVQGKRTDEDKLAPSIKRCASPAAAIRERDGLIAKWMRQGYELETFDADRKAPAPVRRKRVLVDCSALEAVIEEDPFDDGRWQVLEDFLLEHSEDPRSEIIEAHKQRQLSEEAQTRGAALPLLLGKRHAAISKAM
jgi:predicted DNA-binding WGR domain protein